MLEVLLARLEAVATRLESIPPGSEYDRLTQPALAAVVQAAAPLQPEVQNVTSVLEKAFKGQQVVLQTVAQCQKPDVSQLTTLVGPVAEQMQAATALTEGRRSAAFNHQKTVAEALHALTWLVYTGPGCGISLPAQQVEESWNSAQFWANKVLTEFRSKDPQHVEWVKALKELFDQLKAYVKQHHVAGPAWNRNGVPVSQFKLAEGGDAAAPAAGAPKRPAGPQPPPPPAAGSLLEARGKPAPAAAPRAAGGEAGMTAGDNVTQGLRKVTDDMKTKNRADRSGAVSVATKPADGAPSGRAPSTSATPARVELEQGRKWCVEGQVDNRQVVVDDTSPKQTVYIYACKGSTVQVKGKVNAITMDSCSRVGLLFDDIVASVEVVNSQNVQLQCTGRVPTVAVDKTDGIQLYLSEQSLDVAITTAKSSEINLVLPGKGDADPVELPVPEQFVSTIQNGRLVTEPVSHGGG
eukprot:jgi/Astpho2/7916/Aster-06394